VDVTFDSMLGITVNEANGHFTFTSTGPKELFLHLADNTTVFQIGANEGEDMSVNIGDMRSEALGLNSVLVTDRESAARSITIIDNAIDKVSMQRAKIGAYQNRLEHTITNLTVAGENLTAAESRIRDLDLAKEMMNFTRLNILVQSGTSMLGITAEVGTTPGTEYGFFDYTYPAASIDRFLHLADNTTVFQIGANEGEDMGINFGDMRAEALGLNSVLVTDRESAARSITVIDNAIDKVSMQRARIGAYQNRLEHTITNLTVAGENLTAAESRIRDTDMAKEMMNFTKLQIMLQAGTSMLAQANTLPQNVLSLLR
jgi:flagellin-like hook-associated protein FlgL